MTTPDATDDAPETFGDRLVILRMTVENIMRISFAEVEFDPDGGLELIAGKNTSGKSSLLHAVWLALAGPDATREIKVPVRDGEDTASVFLDLGELRVHREWDLSRKKPSKLVVSRADGRPIGRPQEVLDELLGAYSFDPLAFMAANDTGRSQMLLTALGIDVTDIEARIDENIEKRRDAKKELAALTARFDAAPRPADDVPEVEVPAAELFAKIGEARRVIEANNLRRLVARDAATAASRAEFLVEQKRAELAEAILHRDAMVEAADATAAETAGLVDPDTTLLEQQVTEIEATNATVREANVWRSLKAEHHTAVGKVADFELLIAEDRAKIKRQIEAAVMPVPGLAYDADNRKVMFSGFPVENASGAEQLRVSLGIAMSLNPHIRIIRVVEGSGVDQDGLRLIDTMAREHGFQVLLETVDMYGPASIVMEEGRVAARGRTGVV